MKDLISSFKEQEGLYVLDNSYVEISDTLKTRAGIVIHLQGMRMPQSDDEIAALKLIRDQYKALNEQLRSANDGLAEYVKTLVEIDRKSRQASATSA